VAVSLSEIIVCPSCHSKLRSDASKYFCTNSSCRYFSDPFPTVGDQPALIDFERSIFDRADINQSVIPRDLTGRTLKAQVAKFVFGENAVAAIKSNEILLKAKAFSASPLLLVIGGGAIGSGAYKLYQDDTVQVIGMDVFASQYTHLLADAHYLPFSPETFDVVWIQAVLEHVLDPHQVVAEIHRVLKPRGILYADTPFMWPVHEQAYDFTRFTLSGHRWLFRRFEEIDSGVVGGPGIATMWSVGYLVRAFGFKRLAALATGSFFWLRFLDRFADRGNGADAASSVYFFGVKSDKELQPKEMAPYYAAHR
jgi:SAM-dependent methyltransferase